ncbi:hypothetical protein EW145_g3831 [Phellinidium pouzarii]|uniref:N-alpha-acetyltransferase 40 n=1 Tax=Phellinidium pouzarii TaxID=167371 RepID=A0A4S4L5Z0_9AGAM|nr:hypothetical protein EW145_g3831 [Phellinidium pouzarii]
MTMGTDIRHPVIRRANVVSSTEIQRSVPLQQTVRNRKQGSISPSAEAYLPAVSYCFQIRKAAELSQALRSQIWAIFERNMKTIYETTNVFEWNPPEKQEEAFHDLSRFILVTPAVETDSSEGQDLLAYIIFRFEREDKRNVVYVYELQTKESARRLGLGTALITNIVSVGRNLGMTSVMLTHFKVNNEADPFYESLGFKVDRTSPDFEDSIMASASSLPAAAMQASKATLSAALADENETNGASDASKSSPPEASSNGDLEDGEIQEVDMESQADGIRTVFSDPTNFNVKHPLFSPWTLWFDSPSTKGRNMPQTPMTAAPQTPIPQTPGAAAAMGWMEDIKRVISFDSVEEFWGLYNNIEGIIPAWEDDANKNGGKWSIQLPKDKNRLNVDTMWLYTMLAAIGETFDPSLISSEESSPQSLVTGVIVSTRPQFYRISIWTRLAPSGQDEDKLRGRIETIGKHFKMSVLGYSETQKLGGPLATEVEFLSHKDSEKKGKAKKIIV